MKRAVTIYLVLFGLLAFLLPAVRSQAQFDYVEQTGSMTLDDVNGISVYVFADRYTSPDNPADDFPLSGHVTIIGLNGDQYLYVDAPVDALTMAPDTEGGYSATKAFVKTTEFLYLDFVSGTTTPAYALLFLTGRGRGSVAFQIVSAWDGTTLAASAASLDPDTGDWIAPGLVVGHTTIFSL